MKILFISENYPPYIEGGAEISTALLADWLAHEHAVSVATSIFAEKPWIRNGVTVYPLLRRISLGNKNTLSASRYAIDLLWLPIVSAIRILRLVRKLQPDSVNIVITLYHYIPIILALRLFTRSSIFVDCRDYTLICPAQFRDNEIDDPKHTHHGYRCLTGYRTGSSLLKLFVIPFALYESLVFNGYKSLLRYAVNQSKVTLVANSEYIRNQLILNGFDADHIALIHNISERLPEQEIPKATPPTFVYAGRLEREKGVWDLIAVAELLQAESREPFRIVIAGTGSEFEALKNYIVAKNISSIILAGQIEPLEVLELYRTSLAIIATSRWPEPFGRFILESISTGTPVIATSTGGTPEGIEDGVTGFLYEPGNVEELAGTMKKFFSTPNLSESMRYALANNRNKYSAGLIGKMRLDLYHKAYEQDRRKAAEKLDHQKHADKMRRIYAKVSESNDLPT